MKRRLVFGAALAATAAIATPFAAGGGYGGQQSVSVILREYAILSPSLKPAVFGKESPLKPGRTTFTIKNAGKFPHNFTIINTSPGGTKFKTPDIAPGKSAKLTVNLKPGSYIAICTVFNGFHAAAGMVKSFSVGTIDEKGNWGG